MPTPKPTFDIDAAIQSLREGKDLTGKEGGVIVNSGV